MSERAMPKPNCTEEVDVGTIEFGRLGRRVVEGRFDGGSMISDGGVMLLGAVDRKLGLIEAGSHCLKLLVTRLRKVWPNVRIIFRGDSGFCRQRIINWCERSGAHYIVGLARNARLEAQVAYAQLAMKDQYEQTGLKQCLVNEFSYAAQSWPHERRVITRLEWRAGLQSALHRHQPRWARAGAIRRVVLPARRGREPHQGGAAWPFRHAHELPRHARDRHRHVTGPLLGRDDRAAGQRDAAGRDLEPPPGASPGWRQRRPFDRAHRHSAGHRQPQRPNSEP